MNSISNFGVPTWLITGKATGYTNVVLQEFVKSYDIGHARDAVVAPRANRWVEGFDRAVLNVLSTPDHRGDVES